MKTISLILAASLMSSVSAFAKAYFFTRAELIEKAEVIAIIALDEPEAAKPAEQNSDPFADKDSVPGKSWAYSQMAKGRVEKVLKGTIPDEFVLHGGESFICAQCNLAKGRYLAFLGKDGELWVGTNWQLSLRPIRDKEVEWYVSAEQRFPMTFQNLDEVITHIQTELVKPRENATEKADDRSEPK